MRVLIKHRIEYVALRALSGLFCVLPYRVALAVGAGLAWIAFYILRFRVEEAMRRIQLVLGPECSGRQARRIAWISLRNLFFNGVEILRFPVMHRKWVETYVDIQCWGFIRERSAGQTGAILAVPHMGNWDLAGVGVSLLGVPIFFMARRQKNPLTDAYLNRLRGVTGVETVLTDDSGALRKAVRNLKVGKVWALLPDVRARETGIEVGFLGGMAALATGMDAFARRAHVPIVPACAYRYGWTKHRWVTFDPVLPDHSVDKETDQRRIMEEVMTRFDAQIRSHPEQYFWYNKRWILDPLDPPVGKK